MLPNLPPHDAIPLEQDVKETLAIPDPQLLTPKNASKGSTPQTQRNHRVRQIKPHQRVSSGQDQGSNAGVSPLDDPSLTGDALGHDPRERIGIERLPIRLMEDRVEFDVLTTELRGETTCERRLPAATVTEDENPIHP